MMKPRAWIDVGGLWLAPLASDAQPARKVFRAGHFGLGMAGGAIGPQPRAANMSALCVVCARLGACRAFTPIVAST